MANDINTGFIPIRGTKSYIDNTPIVNGQMLFTTDQTEQSKVDKIYADVPSSLDDTKTVRVRIGGGVNEDIYTDSSVNLGRKEGTTIGTYSVTLGKDLEASGKYSYSEGVSNIVTEDVSHAEGSGNKVYGTRCHAEGAGNTINVFTGSHAEGYDNTISGNYCHAEGRSNTINEGSEFSHVQGSNNTIKGGWNHCGGQWCNINHNNCFVQGQYLETTNDGQYIFGKYNQTTTETQNKVFIVGNGTSDVRSNCFTIDVNGRATANSYANTLGSYSVDVNGNISCKSIKCSTASFLSLSKNLKRVRLNGTVSSLSDGERKVVTISGYNDIDFSKMIPIGIRKYPPNGGDDYQDYIFDSIESYISTITTGKNGYLVIELRNHFGYDVANIDLSIFEIIFLVENE